MEIEEAVELTKRREHLATLVKCCPACKSEQIQLMPCSYWYCTGMQAAYKCRICNCNFQLYVSSIKGWNENPNQ